MAREKKNSKVIRYGRAGLPLEGVWRWFSTHSAKLPDIHGDPAMAISMGDAMPYVLKAAQDSHGDWWWVQREIDYSINPSLHACDWRCQRARGRSCECSCMGANHGAGAETRPVFLAEGVEASKTDGEAA